MIWRGIARNVYLAMPEQKGLKTSAFKALGIGLIVVAEQGSAKELVAPSGYIEQDNVKSQELYNQALRAAISQYGILEVDYPRATPTDEGWKIPIAMKNIGSQTVRVLGVLLSGKPYEAYSCQLQPVRPPFEVPADSEYTISLFIPKTAPLEKGKSVEIDFPVEDGIEKGASVYLST
jgi:hypothetical protein